MTWLSRLLRRGGAQRERTPGRPHPTSEIQESQPSAVLEHAIAEYRARRWREAEPLFRTVVEHPQASVADRHAARNILGSLLERNRRIDEAIHTYEANLAERFAGSYPYERLAAIYRKQERADDEITVLRQAISVIESELARGRGNVVPQLERLRAELAEALARQGGR
jgi:tetratricopeptide (TPR) repeat protein